MAPQTSSQFDPRTDRSAVHGLRYQVKDVTAVKFYTTHPGFTLKHQQLPAFANLSRETDVVLSGPGASGSRQPPNRQAQGS